MWAGKENFMHTEIHDAQVLAAGSSNLQAETHDDARLLVRKVDGTRIAR